MVSAGLVSLVTKPAKTLQEPHKGTSVIPYLDLKSGEWGERKHRADLPRFHIVVSITVTAGSEIWENDFVFIALIISD